MKVKVHEAVGKVLDWAVAKCLVINSCKDAPEMADKLVALIDYEQMGNASTDWAQGGPIIEREGISLTQFKEGEVEPDDEGVWCAAYVREDFGDDSRSSIGPTPLIAAMRCFVCSRLGEIVEVPDANGNS